MASARSVDSSLTSEVTAPSFPARPVRPTCSRCSLYICSNFDLICLLSSEQRYAIVVQTS